MTDDRQQVVIVVSSQGLGGVTPYGRAIRDTGRIPLLITGPAPQSKIEAWRSIYDEIEFVALETLYNQKNSLQRLFNVLENGLLQVYSPALMRFCYMWPEQQHCSTDLIHPYQA